MTSQLFDISFLLGPLTSRSTILVPNHRTADAIQQAWMAHQSAGSWLQPKVLAVDIWLREYWHYLAATGHQFFSARHLLEPKEELLIWSFLIQQSNDELPLANSAAIAGLARSAYQLLQQWCPEQSISVILNRFSGIRDVRMFLEWNREFASYCQQHNVVTLSAALPELQEAIKTNLGDWKQPLCFTGFDNPPPAYRNLLQSLKEHWQAEHKPRPDKAGPSAMMTTYRFETQEDELSYCANWIQALVQEQGTDVSLAVVTTDPDAIELTLALKLQLSLNPLSYSDLDGAYGKLRRLSHSVSLIKHPLITFILDILELNLSRVATNSALEWLQNPYLNLTREESIAVSNLELHLRSRGEFYIRPASIRQLLGQSEKSYFASTLSARLLQFELLRKNTRNPATAQSWTSLFIAQMNALGLESGLSTKSDVFAFEKLIESFVLVQTHQPVLGQLSLSGALNALRLVLSEQAAPTPLPVISSVYLLSPEEAVDLEFDHVWLVGLDSQSWPPRTKMNPLVPLQLQRELEIPGTNPSQNSRNYKELINQLMLQTRCSVTMSYFQFDGDLQRRPSNLVDTSDWPSPGFHSDGKFARFIDLAGPPEIDIVTDLQLLPMNRDEQPKGGTGILSSQSQCPFKAFAAHRLECKSLMPLRPGLTRAAQGNALHHALQVFWENTATQETLLNISEADLQLRIEAAVETAISRLRVRYPETMTPRLCEIEKRRLSDLISQILLLEKQRPRFCVWATEYQTSWQIGKLSLNVFIDRIDSLADGTRLVIDYKAGSVNSQIWHSDRPDDTQLAVYYLSLSPKDSGLVSGAVLAQVSKSKVAYLGVCAADNQNTWLSHPYGAKDWNQLTLQWPVVVERLAEEFVQGEIRVQPSNLNSTCQYCNRQSLCRVGEDLVPIIHESAP